MLGPAPRTFHRRIAGRPFATEESVRMNDTIEDNERYYADEIATLEAGGWTRADAVACTLLFNMRNALGREPTEEQQQPSYAISSDSNPFDVAADALSVVKMAEEALVTLVPALVRMRVLGVEALALLPVLVL